MLNKLESHFQEFHPNNCFYKKGYRKFKLQEFEEIYWNYHPFTEKYFFEGNPAYLDEFQSLYDMSRYPWIMVRDGFIGLLTFFLKYPKPPQDLLSNLIIHEQFSSLVPRYWEGRILFYRLKEIENSNDQKSETLVLHGMGIEELYWGDSFGQTLELLKKSQAQNILAFCPTRPSFLSSPKEKFSQFHLKLSQSLFNIYGDKIQIFENMGDFQLSLKPFKNFRFINLDQEKIFNADNYMDHFCYAQGGRELEYNKKNDEEQNFKVRCSLNHEIEFFQKDLDSKEFFKYFLALNHLDQTNLTMIDYFRNAEVKKIYHSQSK